MGRAAEAHTRNPAGDIKVADFELAAWHKYDDEPVTVSGGFYVTD